MITYRKPVVSDAIALAELAETTFVETFGHLYSTDNLSRFLSHAYSEVSIASDIRDERRLIRVVEDGNRMVGYCKLGFEVSLDVDLNGRKGLELKQLYIRQSHLGSGIAQALMDWTLEVARERDVDDIVLSVWSENFRAQRFYQKYGFRHIGNTIFMVGDHQDDEFLYGRDMRAA